MAILNRSFLTQTAERAIKTAAQFGLVFLGADAFDIMQTDLVTTGGYMLAGAVVSVLTSIASEPFHERGSPSAVGQ
jgi:hypothetical protein